MMAAILEIQRVVVDWLVVVLPWVCGALVASVVVAGIRKMIVDRRPVERIQVGLVPSSEFVPTRDDLDSFHSRVGAATTNMAAGRRLFGSRADVMARATYVLDSQGQVVFVLDIPAHAASFFHGPILGGVENWLIEDLLDSPGSPGVDVAGSFPHRYQIESDGLSDRAEQIITVVDDVEAGRMSVEFDNEDPPLQFEIPGGS